MEDRVHPRVTELPPLSSNEDSSKDSQRRRGRFFYTALGLLILVATLLGVAARVFYLICRPKSPSFSVQRVSVHGVNVAAGLRSETVLISPVLNITVKAENPNEKIGVYYERGSFVSVYYGEARLCGGGLPVFYQAPMNVTAFKTELVGGNVVLSSDDMGKLAEEQKKERVALRIQVHLAVRIRVGKVRTWKLTASCDCRVALSALTAKAKVVSKECKVSVHLW